MTPLYQWRPVLEPKILTDFPPDVLFKIAPQSSIVINKKCKYLKNNIELKAFFGHRPNNIFRQCDGRATYVLTLHQTLGIGYRLIDKQIV